LNFPWLLWPGILILGIILAATSWGKNKKIIVAGFCLMILAGGAGRYLVTYKVERLVQQYNDKGIVVLAGIISEEPDVRSDNTKYKLKLADSLGNILLVAKKYPQFAYGDKIEIVGKLKTPQSSEDFDYQKYLAKDDVYSIIYFPETRLLESSQGNWLMGKLLWIKNKFRYSINRILVEPQGAFLAGLLLGEKRGLPPDLMENFSRTGTTHIIALSGFNITIIAVALMSLFNFFMVRRQVSFWLSVGAIVLFVLMTGAAASVVRAAVMGILVLVAQQIGRLYQIKNALIFAGALMIYLNPKILVWDLGFQLSFAATLGLVYILPILNHWFIFDEGKSVSTLGQMDKNNFVKSLKPVWLILATTLAAQIAVLPLLVINFGQLSLIAPLANILILPIIPLTMLAGFLSALGGLLFLPLGQILGWTSWLFLTYEIKIVEILAKIPLAAVNFKWTWLGGAIYYAVLIWLIWRFNSKQKILIEKMRI